MIYQVKAKFKYDKAQEFYQKLTDGTIEKQRPDGEEIVSSMNRATIDKKEISIGQSYAFAQPRWSMSGRRFMTLISQT